MARLMVSTCGVLAEVAVVDTLAPAEVLIATGVLLGVTVLTWWSAAQPVIDRMVGMNE
jgi:hypothetical protein